MFKVGDVVSYHSQAYKYDCEFLWTVTKISTRDTIEVVVLEKEKIYIHEDKKWFRDSVRHFKLYKRILNRPEE